MTRFESEQDVIGELVRDFPAVPSRIIMRILHAYLETTEDLSDAARATRTRLADALHHG